MGLLECALQVTYPAVPPSDVRTVTLLAIMTEMLRPAGTSTDRLLAAVS
jgi:hypothetical protein